MLNNLFTMIKYDFKNGISKQIPVYLFAIVLNLVALIQFRNMFSYIEFSCFDCMAHLFTGMSPYVRNEMITFYVPITWFVVVIIPAFLIGNYATNDINGYGYQIMLKSKSKTIWFVSKICWCVVSVILYFVVLVVTSICFSLICDGDIDISVVKWQFVNGIYNDMSKFNIILFSIIMPYFTILCVSLIQFSLSIMFSSQVAYVIVIIYYILSAYITNPLFIGNYSMIKKNDFFTEKDLINCNNQIYICVCILLLTIVLSHLYIKKGDLYKFHIK